MNGRDKCTLVNQIRRKVADKNGIDFVIYECTFTGDCSGSCQKSESELSYLEGELEKMQSEGVKINLDGVFTLEGEREIKPSKDNFDKRQEKLEELMDNPVLNSLPPRYLDNLLD